MVPNQEQRNIIFAHGAVVMIAIFLLAVPLLPIGLDVLCGLAAAGAAASGGYRFAKSA